MGIKTDPAHRFVIHIVRLLGVLHQIMANWTALLGSLLLFCPFLLADQIVYLDRPGAVTGDGYTLWEPYFNPKSLNASVGEVIQFVARFDNIQSRPRTAKSRLFTPLIASILRPS